MCIVYRNLKFTTVGGKVLWRGLPKLPDSLAAQ
jgi:hypothetical protein